MGARPHTLLERHGWFDLPRTVGAKLARLIGAAADEVIVTDSVSVNLFKLATAALDVAKARPSSSRTVNFRQTSMSPKAFPRSRTAA